MSTRRTIWRSLLALTSFGLVSRTAGAATEPATAAPGTEMLTIFMRHDESKTLDEINRHLKSTGFFADFPPHGVEVVSWYVMMGIGQVVTLRFPAERLREINVLVEREAWGGYRTEFYPTYDYRALYQEQKAKMTAP